MAFSRGNIPAIFEFLGNIPAIFFRGTLRGQVRHAERHA